MATVTRPGGGAQSYLEGGAVFAGSAIALALAIVLWQFGTAIGLSVGEPVLDDGSASWNVVVAGLWAVWVSLVSAAAGGYIAGRMRSRWGDATAHEVEIRDGIHGLVVGAVATVIAVALIAALSAVAADSAAAPAGQGVSPDVVRIARTVSVIFAFATSAGAALGAAAAWWAATVGGAHRDENIALDATLPRIFRRRV